MAALKLSGNGAKTWLEDYGLEDVSDLNDLEEEEKTLEKIGQRGGTSRGRVFYQWGLPRLVSSTFP